MVPSGTGFVGIPDPETWEEGKISNLQQEVLRLGKVLVSQNSYRKVPERRKIRFV